MSALDTTDEPHFPIGIVERDTGIGRDNLRVWERRYGFPKPIRNPKGERVYPQHQLQRLQRIRRLLDQGLRPGKVVPLDDAQLQSLEAEMEPASVPVELPLHNNRHLNHLLEAVSKRDAYTLERGLQKALNRLGMASLIIDTLNPLMRITGDQWAAGEMAIFEEHFLSRHVMGFLEKRMHKPRPKPGVQPVLLTTLPGDQHGLGLLFAEALLGEYNVDSINLGTELPMDQIIQAAERYQARAVALTFTPAYPYRTIRNDLRDLRERLPMDIDIWIGGEGIRKLRALPEGVIKIKHLSELIAREEPV